jgi:molybdate transport system substrate-binding protein
MRPARSLPALVALLALVLVACATPAAQQPTSQPAAARSLNVFAAASLTDAFEAVGAMFEEANPGVEVVFNFAGSQQLAQQINEGAPADLFASANQRQMAAAISGGRVISGSEQIFVRNRLVVVTPSDNPAGIATLQDLARPGLKLILADAAVPVGQYTLDFLAGASALPAFTASYSPTVLANVVSFENDVRSVVAKVALGEGDAGIVYTSDVALDSDQLGQIAIPDELNTIAAYPIAPVADGPAPDLARRFIAHMLGPEGQRVLTEYGFIPAAPAAAAGR